MADITTAQGPGETSPSPEQGTPSNRERMEEVYSFARKQTATETPVPKPVQGMWDRFVHGVAGKSRTKEILRSVPRGLANVGNNAARAGAELGSSVADALNVGGTEEEQNARNARAKNFQIVSDEEMNAVYGARSDDPVAALTEGLVQATASILVLRGAGIHSALAAGAITDAVAFNPYDPGLSEVLQQHGDKVPGVGKILKKLGDVGSVDRSDSAVSVRLKRVVEGGAVGAIVGKFAEASVWAVRASRAQRVVANPAASVAEKEVAQATIKKADEVVTSIQDGSYTPPGARAAARPNEDGTWRVEEVPKDIPAASIERESVNEGSGNTAGYKNVRYKTPEGSVDVIVRQDAGSKTLVVENIELNAGEGVPQGKVGPAGVRKIFADLKEMTGAETVTGKRVTGANPDRIAERPLDSPRFTRAEAEVQAATADHSLRQADAAEQASAHPDRMWSEADTEAHFETAQKIADAPSEADAIEIVGSEDHFNLGAIGSSEDFNAQLRALVSKYGDAFSSAKRRPVVPQDDTIKAAAEYARTLGLDDWNERVMALSTAKERVHLSVETVLKVAGVRQVGERLAEISATRAARPHDPALMTEARRLLDLWQTMSLDAFEHRSELGRSLNILQAVGKERIKNVRFQGLSAARGEGKQVIEEARAALKEAKSPKTPKEPKANSAPTEGGSTLPDEEVLPPSRDTNAVSAADFSLARARGYAIRIEKALDKIGSDYPKFDFDPEASVKRAEKIGKAADEQRTDPLPKPTAAEKAAVEADAKLRQPQNPIEDLSRWMDGAEKELDQQTVSALRRGERARMNDRAEAGTAFNTKKNDGALDTPFDRRQEQARSDAVSNKLLDKQEEGAFRLSSDMSDEEVDLAVRLFQRSGGEPRNLHAVVDGMKQAMRLAAERGSNKQGFAKVADWVTTVFINSLISGARTAQSIFYSGAAMNALEATSRVVGGAATLNKGLATEGLAQWYAMARYARENVKSAAAAFREGTGVLEGTAPLYMKSGLIGTTVTVPGRVAGAIDEFTRVTGYRAEEFAKSLRMAQEQGLSWQAAVKRAEADVRASIDPETGIGLNPEALRRAGVATLSDPLGHDTFVGKMANALAESTFGKLIVPFMRPSVNTFRYVWQNTPGLNWVQKESRAIMLAGGEEATVLHTRSLIAGSMTAYAYTKFSAGEMTGAGPSDPALRKVWLGNGETGRQPYSIKVGDQWVSYRRMEPFASWLGLMADAVEGAHEIDSSGDQQSVMSAVFTALLKNSYNKSWTQGLASFLDAWDAKDKNAVQRFASGLAAGFVPQFVSQFNTDPVLRDARSVVDAMRARVPGLSKDLPARYNLAGEPIMKQGSLWNRNFSVAQMRPANASTLEDVLVENNIALQPFPSKVAQGQINLLDPQWEKNGVPAYVRLMDLLREKGMREKLEAKIKSEAWQNHSAGTATFPGGQREADLKSIKDQVEQQALNQMLREYEGTGLKRAYQGARYVVPQAARYKGPDAEAAARENYGVPAASR